MGKKRAKTTDVLDVEITEEMIKAGVTALRSWSSRYDTYEFAVETVFKAMMAARK